jgi:hypothetical protein
MGLWRLGLEGIPQGLKPLFYAGIERDPRRPKAKALGYLEATAATTADPCGMTNKKDRQQQDKQKIGKSN